MSGFPNDIFTGQRFAVVGLGRMGRPAAHALLAMGAGVTVWDDLPSAREAAAAEGLTVAMPEMAGLAALVLSPGIPHLLPQAHPIAAAALAADVPILSDVDLLYRAVRAAGSKARFVGITGTNGKSTTTALLAHVLEQAGVPVAAGGNLGTAALALPLLGDDGVYCLEMSSYMLERLARVKFLAAAMLNISPDHIDRHGDLAGYATAKLAVFDRQAAGDLAVVGIDDACARAMAATLRSRAAAVVTISGESAADVWCDGRLVRNRDGAVADLSGARALPGAHNGQNAAAVAAIALFLGVSKAQIAAGMTSYPGLPHRQENVGVIGGVTFINDSKATNADSTARALGCYDRLLWIAGGTSKEGGIEPLAEYFPRVAEALLIGRDAPILAATLAAHGVKHRIVVTLEAATQAAWAAASAGAAPVVLLSPACASWDQFTGFDQRGDRFRQLVSQLQEAS
jgi:UDP-N-acetylmuramoylalanine--D-glutamate ligase